MSQDSFHLMSSGINVPNTSTPDHPVDRVRGRKDVTIGTIPESSTMLQDPCLGLFNSADAAASLGYVEPECVETPPWAFGAPFIAQQQPITHQ